MARALRTAGWVIGLACTLPFAAAVHAQTAEAVATEALAAFDAGDWPDLARLAHPKAVDRFRQLVVCEAQREERSSVDDSVPSLFRYQRPAFTIMYGVSHVEQLETSGVETLLRGYFSARPRASKNATALQPGNYVSHRIVGVLQEADSVAYVVYEDESQPVADGTIGAKAAPSVMSLERSDGVWKVMLDGGIIWPAGRSLGTCDGSQRASTQKPG